jgi:hypothetical protein
MRQSLTCPNSPLMVAGDVSTKYHINKFWCKCIKHDISDLKVLCRLFAFTFRGHIEHWFKSFPTYHIIDWFEFVEEFLDALKIYVGFLWIYFSLFLFVIMQL